MSAEFEGAESRLRAPSIVISYANQDADVAGSIADALIEESLTCWLAARDIPIGSNFAEEISRAIAGADFLLVLLSPQSITSPHVKREVNMAIDKGVTLLPVLLGHHSEFMGTLPDDWNYWLSLAQFVTFTDTATTVAQIAKEIRKKTGAPLRIQPIPTAIAENRSSALKPDLKLPESVKPQPKTVDTKKAEPKPQKPKIETPAKTVSAPVADKSGSKNPKGKVYAIASAILAIVLIAGVAFAMTHNSPPKNSLSEGPSPTPTLPLISASPSLSPTLTKSAMPSSTSKPNTSATSAASVKTTAIAKPKASIKPPPTATPKLSSSTNQKVIINQTLVGKLTTAATATLKNCVSQNDSAPTGCPFHEKIWVHGLNFIWSLRGTPQVTSVIQSGSAFSGSVIFSVVDKITYETSDSKVRTSPQTITARAYFRPNGSKYTITWK